MVDRAEHQGVCIEKDNPVKALPRLGWIGNSRSAMDDEVRRVAPKPPSVQFGEGVGEIWSAEKCEVAFHL